MTGATLTNRGLMGTGSWQISVSNGTVTRCCGDLPSTRKIYGNKYEVCMRWYNRHNSTRYMVDGVVCR